MMDDINTNFIGAWSSLSKRDHQLKELIKISLADVEVEKDPLEDAIDQYLNNTITIDELEQKFLAEKRKQEVDLARKKLKELKNQASLFVNSVLEQIEIIKGDEEHLK